MLSQALGLRLQGKEITRRTLSDLYTASYQKGLLEYYGDQTKIQAASAATARMQAETAQSTAARQWFDSLTEDTRTAMIKEYEYAKEQGYTGGLEDWKALTGDPTLIRLYNASIADKSFTGEGLWDFIKEYQESGRDITTITPYERTRQTQMAMTEADVMAPDFASKTFDDISADKFAWLNPPNLGAVKSKYPEMDDQAALERARQELHVREMDSRVRQVFRSEHGYEVKRTREGWTVNGALRVRNPYYGR